MRRCHISKRVETNEHRPIAGFVLFSPIGFELWISEHVKHVAAEVVAYHARGNLILKLAFWFVAC